ncbi:hypothetical protein PIB30_070315 [Stylosanthes scabra]|uniref:Uncharacterized protein n=1 Tax=Stylosanthes scabra TaxID=79078 RepID=A0ABU6XPA5_9FABA|nr:hypothetical protein [Stylosanthes scabra]
MLMWRRWMNGGGDHSKRRRQSRRRQKAAEDLKLFTKKKNLLKNKKLLTIASPLMWRRWMNGGGDHSKRRRRSRRQRQSAKRRALTEVQRWMIKSSIASSMHEGGTKLDDQSLILIFDPDLVNDVTIKLLDGHWFPKLWVLWRRRVRLLTVVVALISQRTSINDFERGRASTSFHHLQA